MCEEIASREGKANCSHPMKTVCFYIFHAFPRLRARFENSSKIALQLHWESHLRNNAFWDLFLVISATLRSLWGTFWHQDGPQEVPKISQVTTEISPRLPKRPEEAPKRCQKLSQEPPRDHQEPPRGPKIPPRGPQEAPKTLQEVPKRLASALGVGGMLA